MLHSVHNPYELCAPPTTIIGRETIRDWIILTPATTPPEVSEDEPTPVTGIAFYTLGALTLVLFLALGFWVWLMMPTMPWPIKLALSSAFSLLGTILPYWEYRENWHNNETAMRIWRDLKSQAFLGITLNFGLALTYLIGY